MNNFKHVRTLVIAMGLPFLFLACNPQTSQENSDSPAKENASASAEHTIYSDYLLIKDALVQTDGKAAQTAAQQLISNIGEAADDDSKAIVSLAVQIQETGDTDIQRQHFFSLSKAVHDWVKAGDAPSAPIYKQYCPMAFDNTGAFWLASEKEINNPYFGDMMLHCGAVEEVIE